MSHLPFIPSSISFAFLFPFENVLGLAEVVVLCEYTDFMAAITDNWTPVLLTSKTFNTPLPTQQLDFLSLN